MMYRSGFATKAGQEVVLGVDITREGFEEVKEEGLSLAFFVALEFGGKLGEGLQGLFERSHPVGEGWENGGL